MSTLQSTQIIHLNILLHVLLKIHMHFSHKRLEIKSWTLPFVGTKGVLARYGKLTWESAHAWILKILCYLIVWGITLIFMVRLSFYAIPLLIYDVMNDITIIP